MVKKKYYGKKEGKKFGKVKNEYANMPQEVVHEMYPKGEYGIEEGYYVDTEPAIDYHADKTASKVRSSMKRNMQK